VPATGQSFIQTAIVNEPPDVVIQQVLNAIAGTPDFQFNAAGPNTLVVTRRYTPTWAVVIGVVGLLLFLIGLLAFLVKVTETLTITASATDEGTRVSVNGVTSAEIVARINAVLGLGGGDRSREWWAAAAAASGTPLKAARVAAVCPLCQQSATDLQDHLEYVHFQQPAEARAFVATLSPGPAPLATTRATCLNGHVVPASQKFCGECGAGVLQCPEGHRVAQGQRFCGVCGLAVEHTHTDS
jgi:hypothetical protein